MLTYLSNSTTNPYIDLHAHLQFADFDMDRQDIICEMKEKNIKAINVGTTYETSLAAVALAQACPDICYATVGTHPVHAVEGQKEQDKHKMFEDFFTNENTRQNIVGIGECGLDFFRRGQEEELSVEDGVIQERIFQQQIDLAKKYKKPLMLHVRDSYAKTLEILSKNFTATDTEYRGNAHFFIGTKEEAKAFLDLGFSVSFTGVITFVKAYEELVSFVPLDKMLAETDSPYVSPVPFRGKKNTPVHVIEIYKKIAEIKGVSLDTVIDTLYENAKKHWL